ncbi:MAG: hypothetical protein AUJ32_01775 [Parcubacteria group bacterium CG1_02_40_82]|uniref:Uncharacterized protein n=4 Tax=Candidatus Portnoyibacteriota TaxID=1817913 RepID=A0A2M7IIT8_9BACT|nr:MAG: hypothetical protein AUJ32_01775 [Parcubacteria group bacterium CG1_02_40_82]PIQ75245.1 MAG: hypothetical protein COV84_02285 [Candidatus Portnoybacteria bacterium CG11_big_fil_rev_8_21_14_0_20_40_15]PIS31889.1 MAG: hypothetical protein COT41_00575 [Candidatus Portnoybacteria bacterium CG08_land_8_20_14_0_20_40_83]PIW76440.1 MAG: hypothetical protein CO001_01380 [Candidatus Portnoybacteria bacterium CG_4_8_14_3_um_filter_40_10]PIY74594.1 MAG: hypothetical protein COY85_02795 [Candidatus
MDVEKCRYGKKHSLITMSSSVSLGNLEVTKWCEVCGLEVKEISYFDGGWKLEKRIEKIPQITKEVLAIEKVEAEQSRLGYDGIFFIDDQCSGQ